MAKIKYAGAKARKDDNVAGTGVAWFGHGDVQEVPDAAVGKLLKHPDVWQLVGASEGLAAVGASAKPEPEAEKAPAKFVLDGPDGTITLDAMSDDELRAWVAANLEPAGVKIDGRLKGDKLRAAIVDAVKAAGAEG